MKDKKPIAKEDKIMREIENDRDLKCPECSSIDIKFDEAYGFYTCNTCSHYWAYPEDDPDLEELDEEFEELIDSTR